MCEEISYQNEVKLPLRSDSIGLESAGTKSGPLMSKSSSSWDRLTCHGSSSNTSLLRKLSQLSEEELSQQKPELDLREVDGRVTREIEPDGVIVERRYKVMWDQRQQIDHRDLTDDHRIVGVKVDHHKVVQPRVVTVTEKVNTPKVIQERQIVANDGKRCKQNRQTAIEHGSVAGPVQATKSS